LIGALIGAFTVLPETADRMPALPLPFPPPAAKAAVAGRAKPTVSAAMLTTAEIQRDLFYNVAPIPIFGRVRDDCLQYGPSGEPAP
jgi:hypothetical protein